MRLTLAHIVFLVKPLALLEEIHDVGLRTIIVVDLPESKRSLLFAGWRIGRSSGAPGGDRCGGASSCR